MLREGDFMWGLNLILCYVFWLHALIGCSRRSWLRFPPKPGLGGLQHVIAPNLKMCWAVARKISDGLDRVR
jgi:hypothetical protein